MATNTGTIPLCLTTELPAPLSTHELQLGVEAAELVYCQRALAVRAAGQAWYDAPADEQAEYATMLKIVETALTVAYLDYHTAKAALLGRIS
jgi:hypothetical protein